MKMFIANKRYFLSCDKSSQLIRTKNQNIRIHLINRIYASYLIFLSELCIDKFFKRVANDLLNKYVAVMEKAVDNEELMECMRRASCLRLLQ